MTHTWGNTHSPEAYHWTQLTAGGKCPKKPVCEVNSHWDSQKREWLFPAMVKTHEFTKNVNGKIHQQLQKREEDNPGPGITKTTSNPWEKWSQQPKRGIQNAQEKLQLLPKAATWRRMVWKMKNVDVWQNGLRFWAFSLPRKLEHVFQKWVSAQFEFWLPILFPFHAITNSTTFWQK